MPVKSFSKDYIKDIFFMLALLAVTIGVTYFASGTIASIWYFFVLVLYAVTDNEAMWLAFFLATVDGFMGFLGLYSVTLTVIPGLPGVELAQFYVLIAFLKALRSGRKTNVFYFKYLQILLIYVLFMVVWGQSAGFSGGLNTYFRVAKMVLPLTLFYSLPHLFNESRTYERFFGLIFFILITAFLTQIFSLLTGIEPAESTFVNEDLFSEPGSFRGFYNAAAVLIALYGALFYLSLGNQRTFSKVVLYTVISATMGMAVISATRGWIIGLGFIIVVHLAFLMRYGKRGVLWMGVFVVALFFAGMSNLKISEQVQFSKERVMTLGNLAGGDISAKKTLSRLDVRSPTVITQWREKPLFGWGFSDTSWKYADGHVGNQNILLLSGLVGFLLLIGFLVYFSYMMADRFFMCRRAHLNGPVFLLFPVFLAGWFIIHSTSGQQFGFSGLPLHIIPQALFFSLGALTYRQLKTVHNGKKV